MNARRLPIAWSIAIALPIAVILFYAGRWIFLRPRATDVDRIIFIAACAITCILIGVSTLVRHGQRIAARRATGQCVRCGYDLRGSPARMPGVRDGGSKAAMTAVCSFVPSDVPCHYGHDIA